MEKENNENSNKIPEMKEKKFGFGIFIIVRILALASSLASACVMVSNNQTALIFGIQMVARYNYTSAFKFLAFANVVASGFALLSLFVSLIFSRKRMSPNCYFLFFLHDLAVMSLELAACGAATAVGIIGKYGNSHAGWMPICDHFQGFCDKAKVSVALSYMAFVFFLCLTILSASSSRNINFNQTFNSV